MTSSASNRTSRSSRLLASSTVVASRAARSVRRGLIGSVPSTIRCTLERSAVAWSSRRSEDDSCRRAALPSLDRALEGQRQPGRPRERPAEAPGDRGASDRGPARTPRARRAREPRACGRRPSPRGGAGSCCSPLPSRPRTRKPVPRPRRRAPPRRPVAPPAIPAARPRGRPPRPRPPAGPRPRPLGVPPPRRPIGSRQARAGAHRPRARRRPSRRRRRAPGASPRGRRSAARRRSRAPPRRGRGPRPRPRGPRLRPFPAWSTWLAATKLLLDLVDAGLPAGGRLAAPRERCASRNRWQLADLGLLEVSGRPERSIARSASERRNASCSSAMRSSAERPSTASSLPVTSRSFAADAFAAPSAASARAVAIVSRSRRSAVSASLPS